MLFDWQSELRPFCPLRPSNPSMRELRNNHRVRLGLLACLAVLAMGSWVVAANAALPQDGGGPTGARPAPVIYRPPGLSFSKAVPLVVALHASGGTPASFEAKTGWDKVANAHGFVVAYLGSAAPAWKDTSNIGYISSEITSIEQSQHIDARRVYETGFSAGAYISYGVGCQLSRQVAAIAPVSDSMPPQTCHLARPVSEFVISGTNDLIPLAGVPRLGFPPMQSVEALWRKLDGCPAGNNTVKSSTSGAISNTTWGSCADGSAVQLDIINGGIHIWPGSSGTQGTPDGQINAASVIWSFFSQHFAGSLKLPSATVTRVRVHKAGTRRSLLTTFRLHEGNVTVSAFAYRGGHRVASQGAKFSQAGAPTMSLRLPGRVHPGHYTERLTLRDAYGRSVTVSRGVNVT
jgi:polyhydroxybutyrate depolymerase